MNSDLTSTDVLARIVFPDETSSTDVIPVYVRSGRAMDEVAGVDGFRITGRRSIEVDQGTVVHFDTFFNAFPASYWRRWTSLATVQLRLTVRGRARVDVYRSSGNGRVNHETSRSIDATQAPESVVIDLPIAQRFSDGGAYWFTLRAEGPISLLEGAWASPEAIPLRGASLGICTFNRVADCTRTLRTLIADPGAMDVVTYAFVVDQGTEAVSDHPDFAAIEADWAGRIRMIHQKNLGGSGGFSRAMYEVLRHDDAGDVILTDDDIFPEPESFRRAVVFASASQGRVIVHGHMLDLWAQSRLHNTGDLVDRSHFRTVCVDEDLEDLDLREANLSITPELNHRFEGEFGGWWMCLIPRELLERLGLAMPVFIKWDDVEYGLRALAAGAPTITLPGAAVWHQPFYLKDVQSDWTAYFECRNRLLTAIIHGEPEQVRAALNENLKIITKNALSMNYSALELNRMALEDVLKGPEFIGADLPDVMQRVRAARGEFVDAKVLSAVPADFRPTVSRAAVRRLTKSPQNRVEALANVGRAVVASAARGVQRRQERRVADLSGATASWAVLARLDTAAVPTADGTGVTLRQRDSAMLWSLVKSLLTLNAEVMRHRVSLQSRYRDAFEEWVSPTAWAERFGIVE